MNTVNDGAPVLHFPWMITIHKIFTDMKMRNLFRLFGAEIVVTNRNTRKMGYLQAVVT